MQNSVTWGASGPTASSLCCPEAADVLLLFEAPLGSEKSSPLQADPGREGHSLWGWGHLMVLRAAGLCGLRRPGEKQGLETARTMDWVTALTTAATPVPAVRLQAWHLVSSLHKDFLSLRTPASTCPGFCLPACTPLEEPASSA